MPRIRAIDAHVHFWDPAVLRYPWLAEAPALGRSFVPRDFPPFTTNDLESVVFVEANVAPPQAHDEVRWVDRLADAEPRIAGIVAFVDLLDVGGRAAALEGLSAVPRVVGVRHNIQHHQAGYALQPAFVDGVRAVAAAGRPFDLCITAEQLPEVVRLVEQCPEASFVLDHCGKPAIRDDAFDDWARGIERLAAFGHVVCKISGLLTEAREDQRTAPALARWVSHVRDCFGASRLLYGSDWPVSTLGGGVERWRAIVDELTAAWSEDDRRALFVENAARCYGVKVAAHG
jgi:L-fuconolactonase